MKKYVCTVCGYVYDPEVGDPDAGIAPGTAFEDLPDDFDPCSQTVRRPSPLGMRRRYFLPSAPAPFRRFAAQSRQ